MLERDADYFLELQTQTGWGRTLANFADWCAPAPGWSTLDVGCGPGLLPAIFASKGCSAFGVDIDAQMFKPRALHPGVAAADVFSLPFISHCMDMLTATNLLFLLAQPVPALLEMKRVLREGGKLALLNPSEKLTVGAASAFADDRDMEGIARDTLLNWAKRAEENHHWTEAETRDLLEQAGIVCMASTLKVGRGFGRFTWGTV